MAYVHVGIAKFGLLLTPLLVFMILKLKIYIYVSLKNAFFKAFKNCFWLPSYFGFFNDLYLSVILFQNAFRDFIKIENAVLVALDSHGALRHEHCFIEQLGSQTVPLGQQCQLSPQSIASSIMQQPIREWEYSLMQQVVLAGQPVRSCISCFPLWVCRIQYFEPSGALTCLESV